MLLKYSHEDIGMEEAVRLYSPEILLLEHFKILSLPMSMKMFLPFPKFDPIIPQNMLLIFFSL